jgi:hypothetical protein
VGACSIFTAIPDIALVPDVLAIADGLPREEDDLIERRGWHRFGLGRLAVMAVARAFVPVSHRDQACRLAERRLYSAFAPAAAHRSAAADELERMMSIQLVRPLWPNSAALAAITGAPPAVYAGWHHKSTHGVAVLDRALVVDALGELSARDPSTLPDDDDADVRQATATLINGLRGAAQRRDCVMLHWEQR